MRRRLVLVLDGLWAAFCVCTLCLYSPFFPASMIFFWVSAVMLERGAVVISPRPLYAAVLPLEAPPPAWPRYSRLTMGGTA
jgi:hypothetical protein